MNIACKILKVVEIEVEEVEEDGVVVFAVVLVLRSLKLMCC